MLSYDILSEEEAVAKAHRLQSLSAEFVFPPVSDGPQRVPETAKTAYLGALLLTFFSCLT